MNKRKWFDQLSSFFGNVLSMGQGEWNCAYMCWNLTLIILFLTSHLGDRQTARLKI